MKRIHLNLIVVLVIFIVATTTFAGCGGNESKADQYMVNGDSYFSNADESFKNVKEADTKHCDEALAALKERKTLEPTSWQGSATTINTSYDKTIGLFQQSRAEFEKIKALTDVPDYTGYADLMIQVIDSFIGVVTSRKAIVQWWVDTFTQNRATIGANAQAVANQYEQLTSNSTAQNSNTVGILKQAQDYKKSKNL